MFYLGHAKLKSLIHTYSISKNQRQDSLIRIYFKCGIVWQGYNFIHNNKASIQALQTLSCFPFMNSLTLLSPLWPLPGLSILKFP